MRKGFLEKGEKECPKPIMKWEDDQAVRELTERSQALLISCPSSDLSCAWSRVFGSFWCCFSAFPLRITYMSTDCLRTGWNQVTQQHFNCLTAFLSRTNTPPGTCSMKILMYPSSETEPKYWTMFLCFRYLWRAISSWSGWEYLIYTKRNTFFPFI